MEFRCPSCKQITENEFINKVYDTMKYQCLECRKEWKIIFIEIKEIEKCPVHEEPKSKLFFYECGCQIE